MYVAIRFYTVATVKSRIFQNKSLCDLELQED